MPTKLRKVTRVLLKDQSGVGTAQIVASAVTDAVKVYKQGATVTTAVGPIGTGTAVAVRDTGRLVVGDTVQNGTNQTHTATVASIVSRTSITLTKVGASVLNFVVGDRIVVTSNRPTLYTESSGVALVGSSNVTTDAAGQASFYAAEGMVDLIYSGTGITTSSEYDVEAGYFEPHPWIDIRDYGNDLSLAYAALPANGGTIYMPGGTYTLSAVLTITKAGTVILGEHDGSTIIRAAAANPGYHLIELQDTSNCLLKNLQIDGRATSVGNFDCLRIIKSTFAPFNNRFENLYVVNARRNNLRIEGAFDQMFRDCDFNGAYDYATYIDAKTGDNSTHIYFDNCEWNANSVSTLPPTNPLDRAAVRIASGYSVRFHLCRFESNRGGKGVLSANAVYASSCPALSFLDCHFEITADTSNDGYPTERPAQYICLEDSGGWTIIGCTFYGSTDATVRVTYAVRGYNSDNGFWAGGRLEELDTNLSNFDSASGNLTIVDGIIAGTATEHIAQTLKNAVRIGGGLQCPRYADAADVTSRAKANKGVLVFREDTNKGYMYDGTIWNALW